MTEAAAAPEAPAGPGMGLFARLVGVVWSPGAAYAEVAARPRSLGALAVTVAVMALSVVLFLRTDVGQQATYDRQMQALDAFGVDLPVEARARMEAGLSRAWITAGLAQLAFWPIAVAAVAGVFTLVFGTLLGGDAGYRRVSAVVSHSTAIIALQQVFSMALSYAAGRFAGATLGAFAPMLEETSLVAMVLGAIDLFWLWWIVNVSIGLGVLYRRRHTGIAVGLTVLYVGLAVAIAFVRSLF